MKEFLETADQHIGLLLIGSIVILSAIRLIFDGILKIIKIVRKNNTPNDSAK